MRRPSCLVPVLVLSAGLVLSLARHPVARAFRRPPPTDTTSFGYTSDYLDARIRFERQPDAPPGGIAIVGDSIAASLAGRIEDDCNARSASPAWSSLCGRVIARGIPGETSLGLVGRVHEIARHRPSVVFVHTGVNDLTMGRSTEWVAENFERSVSLIRTDLPNSRVVIDSLLPVRSPLVADDAIPDINHRLREVAMRTGAEFTDSFSPLSQDGRLPPSYSFDGIHLLLPGMNAWLASLAPVLVSTQLSP